MLAELLLKRNDSMIYAVASEENSNKQLPFSFTAAAQRFLGGCTKVEASTTSFSLDSSPTKTIPAKQKQWEEQRILFFLPRGLSLGITESTAGSDFFSFSLAELSTLLSDPFRPRFIELPILPRDGRPGP